MIYSISEVVNVYISQNYSIILLLCMDNNLNHITEMKKFVILAFSLLLLAGCSKNEIIIYESSPGTNDPGNEQTSQKEDILITFSASLESRKVTRSMSPMPK